jgi:hypothetical protein
VHSFFEQCVDSRALHSVRNCASVVRRRGETAVNISASCLQLLGRLANLGTPTGPAGYAYSLFTSGSTVNFSVAAIPEPAVIVSAYGGLLIFFALRRR